MTPIRKLPLLDRALFAAIRISFAAMIALSFTGVMVVYFMRIS
jgi:hypothetical protein